MVGVTGFEPATSCSQSRRAANCATPRYNYRLLNCFDKMVKVLLCSPGLRNCRAALCLARIALFRCASSTSLYLPPAAVGFVTQSRRAANCATPRYNYRLLNCFDKMVKVLLCSPGLRNCRAALCLARIALFRCASSTSLYLPPAAVGFVTQSRRAANCATPRYNYRLLNCFDKMVKVLLCSPGLRNCRAALCLARIALFRCKKGHCALQEI